MPPELAATLRRLAGRGHAIHIVKTSSWEWGMEAAGLPVTEVEAAMQALEVGWARPVTQLASVMRI